MQSVYRILRQRESGKKRPCIPFCNLLYHIGAEKARGKIGLVTRGPMYHLFTREDKLKALSEAIRVTKKGGVVFAAYCMGDASALSYGFICGEIYNIKVYA